MAANFKPDVVKSVPIELASAAVAATTTGDSEGNCSSNVNIASVASALTAANHDDDEDVDMGTWDVVLYMLSS
ncbi:hypothetical protein EB796_012159 [Bugula neritina]|uniref:Uncharacterized protein n=1 Tax=Bugula neritina TaxID=10212 RepID=A0A7J7JUB4_BUGNE|nr:hypothetical protein EB796_012159 [Bugula neritina]